MHKKYLPCFIKYLSIISLFLLLSCSGEENKNFGQLSHPTDLNIPANTISITEAVENDLSKFKKLTGIFNQKPVAVIGDDLKKKEELPGEVESINITDEGDILVLDSRQNKIKVFDYKGILLTEFGKTGHGPFFVAGEVMEKPDFLRKPYLKVYYTTLNVENDRQRLNWNPILT